LNSLENRVHDLEKENRYLKSLLDKAGISYALPQPSHSDDAMQADQGSRIVHVTISKDMVNAFYSYFKGRITWNFPKLFLECFFDSIQTVDM